MGVFLWVRYPCKQPPLRGRGALGNDPTTLSECQNPRKPAPGSQDFHPRESPKTKIEIMQFLCHRNGIQCVLPCGFCDKSALTSRGK